MTASWPPDVLQALRRYNLLYDVIAKSIQHNLVSDIQLTTEEESAAKKYIVSRLGLKSDDELIEHLQSQGLSLDDVISQSTLPLRIRKYSEANFGHKVESYFLESKNELDTIVYSLIRVRDLDLANELYLRLTCEGESFSSLSTQYSLGKERFTLGVVGPSPVNRAHPDLARQLLASKPGNISSPFQVDEFFCIIRVEHLLESTLDDEVRQKIEATLFEKHVKEVAQKKLLSLSKSGLQSTQIL